MRVAVIGAGSWGTTVASLLSVRSDTVLWAREPEVVATINARHENPGTACDALPDTVTRTYRSQKGRE